MAHKYKSSNGLAVLGLGLFGGMILGWATRPHLVKRIIPDAKFDRSQHSPTRAATPDQKSSQIEMVAVSTASRPAKLEDLTPIEGIGPKINKVLQEAGITTFVQLAETEVEQLNQLLKEAELRLADAST
jgi:predicted flap endonuclease-1-like 5' DNA nuclease